MGKIWSKIRETKYTFFIENKEIGTLEFIPNSSDIKAIAKIGDNEFTINRTGFWKNTIEITEQTKGIVAKAYAEKWYANSMALEFKNKKYKLLIRNNPLAEWAIIDGNNDLLAYGLNTRDEDKTVSIKIAGSEINQDYLLDFLLWYLFVPIATENMGDNLTFVKSVE
jgi:hypothetical protein